MLFLVAQCHLSSQTMDRTSVPSRITVLSKLDSVEVSTGFGFHGSVPCTFSVHGLSKVALSFRRAGYAPRIDTLLTYSGQDTSIEVLLKKLGGLYITSTPDSAQVRIGTAFVGNTPVFLSTVPDDSVSIAVSRTGYQEWLTTTSGAGDSVVIMARLKREEAAITVLVDPPSASVVWDGVQISKGSVRDYLTITGPHQLIVRDDSTGRSKELLTLFKNPERYWFRAQFGVVKWERIVPAFLVPGSLHIADGEFVKGSVMFLGNMALGYLAILSQQEYNDRIGQYDRAIDMYNNAPTDAEATRRHEDVLLRKSDRDKYYTLRTVTFSLLIAGYAYTVIDALLNHLVGDSVELVPLRDVPGLPFPTAKEGTQVQVKF